MDEGQLEAEVGLVALPGAEGDLQEVAAVVLQEEAAGQIAEEGEADLEAVLEVVSVAVASAVDVGVGEDVVVDFEGLSYHQSTISYRLRC